MIIYPSRSPGSGGWVDDIHQRPARANGVDEHRRLHEAHPVSLFDESGADRGADDDHDETDVERFTTERSVDHYDDLVAEGLFAAERKIV